MSTIYLRELTQADARVSYKWRNIPEVWQYTNFTFCGLVTFQIEKKWLKEVLKRSDQKRFGICLISNDQYIGNVHLSDINESGAEFHLFIGEVNCWGKGIGQEATRLILDYAFIEMGLKELKLIVDPGNYAAIAIYRKQGFVETGRVDDCHIMGLKREDHLLNISLKVI